VIFHLEIMHLTTDTHIFCHFLIIKKEIKKIEIKCSKTELQVLFGLIFAYLNWAGSKFT
jgi:hypothetical protein